MHNATQDEDRNVRQIAVEALAKVPTEQHIEIYWATKDLQLIPYIVYRLQEALLFIKQRQAVLYHPLVGQYKIWPKPAKDLKRFASLIKYETNKTKQGFELQASQGLTYYEQSLTKIQAFDLGNHPDVASALCNVGIAHHKVGHYDQAIEYFKKALKMYTALHKGENHKDVATALIDVGMAHEALKKFTQSLEYFKKALKIYTTLYRGENHKDVAVTLHSIGVVYEFLGKYTKTLKYHKRVLKIYKALHKGHNHNDVAKAILAVGCIYSYLCCLEKAIQHYEQVLDVPAASLITRARVGHNLGCMYHVKALTVSDEGDRQRLLEEANTKFKQAVLVVPAGSAVQVGLYTTYGNFLLATQQTAQAYEYLYQAIERGDDESEIGYGLLEQKIVEPVLQGYISQHKRVLLRAIDYAYYLMIYHYTDFQEAGVSIDSTREDYLAAYQASLKQCSGQPRQGQVAKTAYYLLGSLYTAQGEHEAAALAFDRAQQGSVSN